jgi:hypothetical protein
MQRRSFRTVSFSRFAAPLALLAASLAAPASAAAQTSTVGASGCALAGGHVTRPAGTELVVRQGWAAATRGLVEDFLNAQTSIVTVEGVTADVSARYNEPSGSTDAGWRADAFYRTGIVLTAGESVTFTFTASVSHQIHDGLVFADGTSGRPLFAGPGTVMDFTCTVTGV